VKKCCRFLQRNFIYAKSLRDAGVLVTEPNHYNDRCSILGKNRDISLGHGVLHSSQHEQSYGSKATATRNCSLTSKY
jgi:hypothetical protein